MEEYCKRATAKDKETALAQANINCSYAEVPTYMSLAAQYGLEDNMEIRVMPSVQSVEHEYQMYVTRVLLSNKVDILKFWEVSSDNIIDLLYTDKTL